MQALNALNNLCMNIENQEQIKVRCCKYYTTQQLADFNEALLDVLMSFLLFY